MEPENRPVARIMINLSSFIGFHARRTPDRVALKYRGEDISYAAFDARIRRVGGWLVSRGVKPGDVVAVLMKNSAAFLELVFATSHIGAVFLPINYRLSADEVGYIVGNSGAKLLIADAELADIAAGGAPVVLLDEAAQATATRLAPDIAPAPMHVRQPRDLMRLMYTSGTTDRPKGVMLTYENIYWKSADQTLVLGTERRHAVAGGRPALSCRRAGSAGDCRALAWRHCFQFTATSSRKQRWRQSKPRNSTRPGSRQS